MRLLAIGDIHGHIRALDALLEEVAPTKSDTVVFLGDYVDKGPSVKETLDRLCELSNISQWVFLRGNHDQMFLDACLNPAEIGIWECLAGEKPLTSYGTGSTQDLVASIPPTHIEFLKDRCQDYFEDSSFIFVHGGIRPHLKPEEEEVYRLQWMVLSNAAPHLSQKTIICGHSAQSSGLIADLDHTICIDTSISKGGYLTCLDLTNSSYIQASERGDLRAKELRRSLIKPIHG